jgi:excisionase family DNA binding protein
VRISTIEAALLVGVDRDTILLWSRTGRHGFPRGFRPRGVRAMRFDRAEVEAWLEARDLRPSLQGRARGGDPVKSVLRQLARSECEAVAAWAKGLLRGEDEVEQGPAPRRKKRAAAADYSPD